MDLEEIFASPSQRRVSSAAAKTTQSPNAFAVASHKRTAGSARAVTSVAKAQGATAATRVAKTATSQTQRKEAPKKSEPSRYAALDTFVSKVVRVELGISKHEEGKMSVIWSPTDLTIKIEKDGFEAHVMNDKIDHVYFSEGAPVAFIIEGRAMIKQHGKQLNKFLSYLDPNDSGIEKRFIKVFVEREGKSQVASQLKSFIQQNFTKKGMVEYLDKPHDPGSTQGKLLEALRLFSAKFHAKRTQQKLIDAPTESVNSRPVRTPGSSGGPSGNSSSVHVDERMHAKRNAAEPPVSPAARDHGASQRSSQREGGRGGRGSGLMMTGVLTNNNNDHANNTRNNSNNKNDKEKAKVSSNPNNVDNDASISSRASRLEKRQGHKLDAVVREQERIERHILETTAKKAPVLIDLGCDSSPDIDASKQKKRSSLGGGSEGGGHGKIMINYPPGETRNKIIVYNDDMKTLNRESFLNDTIITFYIRFLEVDVAQYAAEHKLHFKENVFVFNSFFFEKLKQKGHAGVKKWVPAEVDVLSKDFLVIPVNFDKHWFLVVVCFPSDPERFGVLKFDSFSVKTPGIVSCVFDYLQEEWKVKRKDEQVPPHLTQKGKRLYHVAVPQQHNWYDCGVFVLHYLERLFLTTVLEDGSLKCLGLDYWFSVEEIVAKRRELKELIKHLKARTDGGSPFPQGYLERLKKFWMPHGETLIPTRYKDIVTRPFDNGASKVVVDAEDFPSQPNNATKTQGGKKKKRQQQDDASEVVNIVLSNSDGRLPDADADADAEVEVAVVRAAGEGEGVRSAKKVTKSNDTNKEEDVDASSGTKKRRRKSEVEKLKIDPPPGIMLNAEREEVESSSGLRNRSGSVEHHSQTKPSKDASARQQEGASSSTPGRRLRVRDKKPEEEDEEDIVARALVDLNGADDKDVRKPRAVRDPLIEGAQDDRDDASLRKRGRGEDAGEEVRVVKEKDRAVAAHVDASKTARRPQNLVVGSDEEYDVNDDVNKKRERSKGKRGDANAPSVSPQRQRRRGEKTDSVRQVDVTLGQEQPEQFESNKNDNVDEMASSVVVGEHQVDEQAPRGSDSALMPHVAADLIQDWAQVFNESGEVELSDSQDRLNFPSEDHQAGVPKSE